MPLRKQPTTTIHANMTPMIDVIFLLIVFFVAVSQIVDREAVPIDLPTPENAMAGFAQKSDRIVVNVVPLSNGEVAGIVVEGHAVSVEDLEGFRSVIETRLRGGDTEIHLRADRITHYQYIHTILKTIESIDGTQHVALMISGDSM